MAIEVITPPFLALDIPGRFKVRYNFVGSALSYPYMCCYLSRGMIRIMIDIAQNQAMISYEGPSRGSHR
mgnify:CR=1 FL=1